MTPLHQIGNIVRDLLLQIPLGFARALFVLVPLALLIWVLTLPRSAVLPPSGRGGIGGDLRLWASVALAAQIIIYALF